MRYVYLVKSGSLDKSANQYVFTSRFFSSLKNAKLEVEQILKINRAYEIFNDVNRINMCDNFIDFVDYVGEEGKYNGRIILEKHELR